MSDLVHELLPRVALLLIVLSLVLLKFALLVEFSSLLAHLGFLLGFLVTFQVLTEPAASFSLGFLFCLRITLFLIFGCVFVTCFVDLAEAHVKLISDRFQIFVALTFKL